jgi:hypothetical protein
LLINKESNLNPQSLTPIVSQYSLLLGIPFRNIVSQGDHVPTTP